ncbi:DUF1002 domain-containing protein [Amphibacillus xylanus]|uniref:DUF1002 domain-containing protein n=1 Tax=Amphibacillus xylanus (strain ATCC 51415 / DSM 6626 / JCM 7361 / LMG 17667 / NBRC 15112 / Ep01) TaxID=698758 RepID=K0J0E4_AMPXN|nr:DUF1002 domain-containing protein [Amphibacillus xylanus]BAM48330.1 hypothetical protein AXY_21980 [Amphibacillus xylanus NBRC 15112]
MKKGLLKCSMILLAIIFFINATIPTAFADAIAGEIIVTLGEDLSQDQKDAILKEMGIDDKEKVTIIYVTNEEEHNYLGDYIPASQIGSNALSSARIDMRDENTGITVTTNKITYITGSMYSNALATAGISGAEIYVTAPFDVSGTGALTGIMKAYEAVTGEEIDEEVKQAANEEMVVTAELADDEDIDEEQATDLMNRIKEEIEKQRPETTEDLRELIKRVAKELGIDLSDLQLNRLVELFDKLRNLNIDWGKVTDTIKATRNWISDFAESEEGKGLVKAIGDFFKAIWDWFLSVFSND